MKQKIHEEIEIPEGVELEVEENFVKVKGPEGVNSKEINFWRVNVEKKDGKVVLGNPKATKKEKKVMKTIAGHIRNLIKGVQEKFKYQLKVCSTHFPMSVSVDNGKVTIKNFWGEKIPRETTVPEGAEVSVDGEYITVKSIDKETAGKTAASLEAATKIRNRDTRVFQDGIYIINKAGKEI
ncbi:MAG: 50S ribosomal protein L6 [Candidatus Pacearchaeota archaeon]